MNNQKLNCVRQMHWGPSIALSLLIAAAAQAQTVPSPPPSTGMPHAQMQAGQMGSDEMKQSMMKGMDNMQKMKMSGDTDKDFATMMKVHHQQAVEMAQVELAKGSSAEMKAMATQIIAAQKKEIEQFDKWLAKQK